MDNSERIDELEQIITFLRSVGIFANTLDYSDEQYNSLRHNLKIIVPDINIDLIEKNDVIRCHIQSESLDIRVGSNSGGRTNRTNNEQRALRRFCNAVYKSYESLSVQEESSTLEPIIVFKLSHHNWGLMGPGDWNSDTWILYDNNWVEIKRYCNDYQGSGTHLIESNSVNFPREKIDLLISLIDVAKTVDKQVDACDGSAWEFTYYKNNEIVWKRDIGYIYGIEPLEKITKLFYLEPITARTKERFGNQPIPGKIKNIYQQAILKFFGDVTLLTSDEISALKGMCNRCIKHDQGDWRTTYNMIGMPEKAVLKQYVDEIVSIRDDIRVGIYDNVISFRDKYYDIFKSAYEQLCDGFCDKTIESIPDLKENGELDDSFNEKEDLPVNAEIDMSACEQISAIEKFVKSFSPDKSDGRYSNGLKKNIARQIIASGLISNAAFGKRGSEFIAWIPNINIIGTSSDNSKDAVLSLGKRLVVACRQGLQKYYNSESQFSGVLYGEDYNLLTTDKKYSELIEILNDTITPNAKTVNSGRATMVLKRLYDLNIISSPVEFFARGDQYVSKISGIDVEGISYPSKSETHSKNAANKDLVEKILKHHANGTLRELISDSFFGPVNEDWLLSEGNNSNELDCNTNTNNEHNIFSKEEKKIVVPKSINTTVNLSQLDFSFEEKDDDDDFNF